MKDSEIIDAVLAGNTVRFALLVDRHKAMAFTIALRFLKNREDAEEMTQDAFVKAYQNLQQFRRESKFSTWLYRIVFNLCASKARKKKREVVSFDDENVAEPEEKNLIGALDLLERKDNERMIREALKRIDGEEAAMVTMFYYEDCSIEEISGITGYTVSNVKVKLFRARKKLLVILEKDLEKDGIYSQIKNVS